MIGIIVLLITVTIYNIGDIFFVRIILPFPLPGFAGLVCSLAIDRIYYMGCIGPGVIGHRDVSGISVYGMSSLFLLLSSSIHLPLPSSL